MRKKNQKYSEEMNFDSAAYAADIKTACEAKLESGKKALIIAGVATIFSMITLMTDNAFCGTIGIVLGIVSYVWGGGFKDAMAAGAKIAKVGWFLIPIFPIDIMCGLVTLLMTFFIALFFPIAFVLVSFHDNRKMLKEAEKYLNYCK